MFSKDKYDKELLCPTYDIGDPFSILPPPHACKVKFVISTLNYDIIYKESHHITGNLKSTIND